jgi:hypothetical protein
LTWPVANRQPPLCDGGALPIAPQAHTLTCAPFDRRRRPSRPADLLAAYEWAFVVGCHHDCRLYEGQLRRESDGPVPTAIDRDSPVRVATTIRKGSGSAGRNRTRDLQVMGLAS